MALPPSVTSTSTFLVPPTPMAPLPGLGGGPVPGTSGAGFGAMFSNPMATLMVAGAVSSGVGAFYQAKTNKIQLELQADMADINARISELAAQQELARGEREQMGLKFAKGQLKAKQRVAMAANGIAADSGSAQDVLNSTDIMGEIDLNTAEANAIRSAWGYRTQGANYRSEATMSRANAKGMNPVASMGTSLLTSAAYAAPTYYMAKKSGAI